MLTSYSRKLPTHLVPEIELFEEKKLDALASLDFMLSLSEQFIFFGFSVNQVKQLIQMIQVSTSMEVSSSGRSTACPKEVLIHSKAGLEDAGGEEGGHFSFQFLELKF